VIILVSINNESILLMKKETKQMQSLKLQIFKLDLNELKDLKSTIEYVEKRFHLNK